MKKRYLLVLYALLAIMLVACGGATGDTGGEEPAATDEPAATEEPSGGEEPAATEEASGGEEMAMPAECEAEGACFIIAPGEDIKIGTAGPLTGDTSAYGIDTAQAAELAVEQAEAFEGHSFVIVRGDDQGSADGGAAVANDFVSQGVVAVVGHNFSGATNAAMPIYETAQTPMLSPSATRIDLTQQGFSVFNRVIGSDALQGELAANFMKDTLGASKIAVLHDGTAYGQGLAERSRDVFTELGGEVVAFEAITPGETDYSAVLTAIAALEPDVVYLGGYTPEAAVLANQKASVGLGDVPLMSGDGIAGTQFVELAGDNAEGVYATNAAFPADSESKAAFDAAYLEKWGTETGALSGYAWHAFDATNILMMHIRAVAIVGDDGTLYIPKAALVAAVRGTSGYEGLTGTLTCDENGDCTKAGFAVYVVQGGEFVVYEP